MNTFRKPYSVSPPSNLLIALLFVFLYDDSCMIVAGNELVATIDGFVATYFRCHSIQARLCCENEFTNWVEASVNKWTNDHVVKIGFESIKCDSKSNVHLMLKCLNREGKESVRKYMPFWNDIHASHNLERVKFWAAKSGGQNFETHVSLYELRDEAPNVKKNLQNNNLSDKKIDEIQTAHQKMPKELIPFWTAFKN